MYFTVVRSNGSKPEELWSKKFFIFWSNIPGSKKKMILWFWSWNFFDLVILILIFIWSKVQNCLIFDLKIKKKFDPMICNKILAWSFDLNLLSILISWSVFLEFFDPMICIFRIFWSGDLYFQRFDFWSYDLRFPKSRDLQFRFF